MDKELKELMQITLIEENKELTQMIQNITPYGQQEHDVFKEFMEEFLANEEKKEKMKNNVNKVTNANNFSIVVYKKENIIIKMFKEIKENLIARLFHKIGIIKKSKEIEYVRLKSK